MWDRCADNHHLDMAENSTNSSKRNIIILTDLDVPGAKLTQDAWKCNVEILKRWLECHGLKNPGRKMNW